MDWAALFACITALGTGWFAYNQLKHNRLADIKAKELERQLERKSIAEVKTLLVCMVKFISVE